MLLFLLQHTQSFTLLCQMPFILFTDRGHHVTMEKKCCLTLR